MRPPGDACVRGDGLPEALREAPVRVDGGRVDEPARARPAPSEIFYQVAISIFIAEGLRSRIASTATTPAPGDHGFDPVFKGAFMRTPEEAMVMKTKEIVTAASP